MARPRFRLAKCQRGFRHDAGGAARALLRRFSVPVAGVPRFLCGAEAVGLGTRWGEVVLQFGVAELVGRADDAQQAESVGVVEEAHQM